MNKSKITLEEMLFNSHIFDEFGCCKLFVNDEIVWDDDVDFEHYVTFLSAISKYLTEHQDYVVTDINIKIIDFHHSIVGIKCIKE